MKKQHKQVKTDPASTPATVDDVERMQAATYVKRSAGYWAKCGALVVFLLFWTWFVGNQTGWWFTDSVEPAAETITDGTPIDSITADGTTTTNTRTTNGGGGSSTTNNSTTTNTTTTTTNGGGGGGGGGGDEDDTPPAGCTTITLADFFASVQNGQTLQEVTDLACNIQPECLASTTVVLGTQQICTFSEGTGQVIVVFLNDQVLTKVKTGF